jgi:2-C-methyl-D-erythritol 4-phosphate cytidylyltransferase
MTLALVLAAGSGQRLGADRPKALVDLAGKPMLAWSVEALSRARGIERIVLALPADATLEHSQLATGEVELVLAAGGSVRSDSVRRALAAAPHGDPVLVHDAARPLLTPELAEATVAALEADPEAAGAIAAVPVTDTIKRVDTTGAVTETLERRELWAVQTPQVFRRAALERALDVPDEELARATDDAWLVERLGERVVVVKPACENLKVTTSLDLRIAAELLAERRG